MRAFPSPREYWSRRSLPAASFSRVLRTPMSDLFPAPASHARTLARVALAGAALHLLVSLLEVVNPATASGTTLTFVRPGQARLEFLGFGIGDVLLSASFPAWIAARLVGARMSVRVAAWLGVAGFLAFASFRFMIAAGRDPNAMPGLSMAGMFASQIIVPLVFAAAAFLHRRRAAAGVALLLALSPLVIFAILPQFVATAVHALIWAAFAWMALRAAPTGEQRTRAVAAA